MTSRELIRWSSLHERRARSGGVLGSSLVLALLAGGALAAWVAWRMGARAGSTPVEASRAWLAGTLVAFSVAFLRVPFHLYWRADAALLAQLPIEGRPLLDAALWRCVRAAAATTLATAIGAVPLVSSSTELALRHLALAGALGLTAALLMPAVAVWAASIVAMGHTEGMKALRVAAGIDRGVSPAAPPAGSAPPIAAPGASTALLGALPGFAATAVITVVLLINKWLLGELPIVSAPAALGALAAGSFLGVIATRAAAPRVMGTILRDVSALDRQRLATLEIRPPTAIERAIASRIGEAALPYSKDARLMRRRYPMAFALGALVFLVLVIIGVVQPRDPAPWLIATIAGASAYGLALGARLRGPPIELPRLSATLPISAAARERAKLAWVAGWWTIYVLAPGLFAALRQPSAVEGLALVGASTFVVIVAALIRGRSGPDCEFPR